MFFVLGELLSALNKGVIQGERTQNFLLSVNKGILFGVMSSSLIIARLLPPSITARGFEFLYDSLYINLTKHMVRNVFWAKNLETGNWGLNPRKFENFGFF